MSHNYMQHTYLIKLIEVPWLNLGVERTAYIRLDQ